MSHVDRISVKEHQMADGEAQRNDHGFLPCRMLGIHRHDSKRRLIKPLELMNRNQREELQVMNLTLHIWRQKKHTPKPRAALSPPRPVTSVRTCRFPKCWIVVNEGLISKGEDPIALTTTAARGSAAPVLW